MTLLGLRIVRADGGELDKRHALIRLVGFPLGFLTLGLGFLGIIFARTRQAIYDRIADTAVVYGWDAESAKLRAIARERQEAADADRLRQAPEPHDARRVDVLGDAARRSSSRSTWPRTSLSVR